MTKQDQRGAAAVSPISSVSVRRGFGFRISDFGFAAGRAGFPARRAWFVYVSAALLVVAALYACWCGAPLAWDGAYQLNVTLIQQHPYVYRTRFHTQVLWQPVTLVSHYTGNLTAVYMAYGLPFLLAPAAALLICWWLLRRRAPRLVLWVLFGVAVGPLPGQFFVINDSILQQHLFWPLFAAVFVPLDWRQWLAIAALAVFQFAHPIGSVLFFGAGGAALVLAWWDVPRRRQLLLRFGLGAALGAAAVWKALHYPDPYAQQEFTWKAALQCWAGGVQGYPIRGLLFMWTAGVLAFAAAGSRPDRARLLGRLALACAGVGAAVWIYWASDAHRWPWASEYRRWVVPLTMPFYALCWLDYLLRVRPVPAVGSRMAPDDAPDAGDRTAGALYSALGVVAAGVFLTVLVIQSTLFASMTSRLLQDMRRHGGPLVPDSVVAWRWHTALDHWTITDLAITVQGKQTRQLLVSPQWARLLYGADGLPPVFPNYTLYPRPPAPNSNGWYDLRPVLRSMPATPW